MKLRARRSGMYVIVINALLSVVAGAEPIRDSEVWRQPKTLGDGEGAVPTEAVCARIGPLRRERPLRPLSSSQA